MRKGDEKKQDILTVAERLFCTRGYKETSVQDIIDTLKTSKGSFYHHFESKDAVLVTLCDQRAQAARQKAEEKLRTVFDRMARLNILMHAAMPLRREETGFLAMLLPLLFEQEGRMVLACYQDSLRAAFLPALAAELEAAREDGVIYPPKGDMLADLALTLVNRCWVHTAQLMLEQIRAARQIAPAELEPELALYRRALERILDAPYGTVEIIRLPEWFEVAQTLARQVKLQAIL